MRCPNCHNDHKKKYGMTCSCGYRFVFHPANDGITDGKFAAILKAASANDTWYFTFNGLYATYCRKKRYTQWSIALGIAIGVAFLAAGIGILVLNLGGNSFPPAWVFGPIVTLLGAVIISCSIYACFRPIASPEKVRKLLDCWRGAGNEVPKLLTKPALYEPPPEWPEADIYDYGAERVVIVEHDLLVDWLVLNNMHATERAVVLSQHGYPEYILPRVEEMLAGRPDLPVFLLHDATMAGQAMAIEFLEGRHRLSHMLTGHPITDLGLNVDDVKRLGVLRAVKPKSVGYEIPVDYVPYGMLTGGMAAAMALGIPLHDLPTRRDDDSGGGGGYG